jgi:hypothetical protein
MSKKKQSAQKDYWRTYYAAAWTFKLNYRMHLIDQGESHPLRLTQLLHQTERKYLLNQNQKTNAFGWQKLNYDNVMPSGTPESRETSYKGTILEVPFYAETNYMAFVNDFLQEIGNVDCILELGSGYGNNLFNLYYQGGPKVPYFGGELSLAGQRIGQTLTDLDKNLDFSFHQFDHIAPDLSWLPDFNKVFVMTVHSIEQVNKIDLDFFRCVVSAAPEVVGLHLEPFGFQAEPDLGPATKKQKEIFELYEWNLNFYDVLREAQEEGLLAIDNIEADCFLPADPTNATSLAVWHKT